MTLVRHDVPPVAPAMRLLFCTTDGANAFNGINAWLLDFLPALVASGHQVCVLIFAWSPPDSCHTYPRLEERGIPAQVVFPMLYTESAVCRCLHEVSRFSPDIFVASHVLPALLALPAIRTLGIPGVSILHNDDAEYRAKATFPADATVAVSKRLLSLIPSDGRRSVCVPYGVPQCPQISRPPCLGGPFRLVYHGRIASHQKRIVETASALARVCRAHPHIHADIYGSGPDEGNLLAQLARDDGAGRLRFLGARSSSDLRTLLPSYHASILLSDFEGLPISVLESMSAGLVPVCLRTESGLPDIIRHDENGLFVSDRDAGFDAVISRLAADPALWFRLSEGAQKTFRNHLSTDACVRGWENLLRDPVLRRRRSPASTPDLLPPPHPDLAAEDVRYPGIMRALWRRFRFGATLARRPW